MFDGALQAGTRAPVEIPCQLLVDNIVQADTGWPADEVVQLVVGVGARAGAAPLVWKIFSFLHEGVAAVSANPLV